jgi:hypothetical protein
MAGQEPLIDWQKRRGETITVGDVRVTPESQALTVRWPQGGLVWNRPMAIWVHRNGEQRRIPILNITRAIVWGLYATVVLIGIGLMLRAAKETGENTHG